ncbi:MAG: synthase subunit epsilon [Planctomycetota bacterium]|jgi:F-type H+-transporting ATPase subunit epsilon
MATFRCTIVTPSDSLLDEQVTYATFQAWDGQKGVAPGASAFLAKLGTGAARLDLASGQSRWFVIDGGFAQMQGDALTLLVDGAEDAGGIDAGKAQTELVEANARANATNPNPLTLEQREQIERAQRRAAVRVALAGRGS